MDCLEKTIQILDELESEGVIEKYAIGGAVASIFYIKSNITFDPDIFILLKKKRKHWSHYSQFTNGLIPEEKNLTRSLFWSKVYQFNLFPHTMS